MRDPHKLPSGVLLAVILGLLLLYVAWRTGRLRGLRVRRLDMLRGARPSPLALLPTVLLVLVIAVLLLRSA